MELRHLRYFVAVADELSFRGAAEKLHVAQPSLSSQIRLLEEEMQVRLLERDTHHVQLTTAGRNFLESCRRTLRAIDDDTRTAQSIASGKAGKISVGYVASLGIGLLPGIMRNYGRSFPDMELELIMMDSSQQIQALHEHRLDLGLIGLGVSSKEMGDLNLATVVEERLYAVVPQNHSLEKAAQKSGKPIPLSKLAKESFLFASRESAPVFNPWLIVLCSEAGFQPHILREAGEPITVLNYIAAGLGVSILPAQFRRLPVAGVTFIPLADPLPSYRYCAAWSPHNRHPAIPHLIKIAKQAALKNAQQEASSSAPRRTTKKKTAPRNPSKP